MDDRGLNDAAILLMSLGEEEAAEVFRACYELYRMMVRVVGRVQGCLVGPTPAM